MLIKVTVGVKRDSKKLMVVGYDHLRTGDSNASYMGKRRDTLESP